MVVVLDERSRDHQSYYSSSSILSMTKKCISACCYIYEITSKPCVRI